MINKSNINELINILKESYPEPECALHYSKDYELLFATRLAAQCTDARVNTVTPILFKRFPTLKDIAQADISEVEKIIFPCGFYRTKARDIVNASIMLLTKFNGKVPDNMEDLLLLPGIGRKTANLILGDIFGKPAIVVDTHCIRLANRIGLVNVKDPLKVEMDLKEILPPDESSDFCHRLVLHGRAVCNARKPACEICTLRRLCNYGKEVQLQHKN